MYTQFFGQVPKKEPERVTLGPKTAGTLLKQRTFMTAGQDRCSSQGLRRGISSKFYCLSYRGASSKEQALFCV